MKVRIYLASPHMSGHENDYIKEAFDSNWIAPLGPNVDGFENAIANYVGSKGALALNAGTGAIHMALKAVGVKEGDKVFCSDLTFAASCNPIKYEKATPIFIDSEEHSFNMSPIALKKAFEAHKNDLPKAVVVVHLYGQVADMDEIKTICDFYKVPIIEDAAEALGATYKGKQAGTIGEFGVYSFNGNKIITTSGGGMLVSDDQEKLDKVKFWITQARENEPFYEHKELGYNYRMSNVIAGIGIAQVQILDQRIREKKHIYESYKEGFKNIKDIKMAEVCDFGEPNFWLSVLTVENDSKIRPIDIIKALNEENIESRHVWKPMHMQPYYSDCEFFSTNDDNTSVSEDLFNRGVCMPSDTKMTDEDIQRIIDVVRSLFN